ncbi:MAG: hypothetical protein FNP40_09130 [Dehalobacter sp. 4CP]|nr:hypothetical protein [Dehalobacter sp. 4CP]
MLKNKIEIVIAARDEWKVDGGRMGFAERQWKAGKGLLSWQAEHHEGETGFAERPDSRAGSRVRLCRARRAGHPHAFRKSSREELLESEKEEQDFLIRARATGCLKPKTRLARGKAKQRRIVSG